MKEQRTKIFQQAMESCHSNNPIDCIEWFADRIIKLKAENEQIKNSDTLCKLIGEQKRKITELEQQIEKMKCCGNCIHFDFNEPNYCHKGAYRERQYVCSEWVFGN